MLSPRTGHRRDYTEGAAYRSYFATDELMYTVPTLDTRLANKAEVLALRGDGGETLAIGAAFLRERPVYHDSLGGVPLVVLTDASGANRVYGCGERRFTAFDGSHATDRAGARWTLTEDALVSGEERLPRMPAHRAFWFGWYAQYPETRLVP